MQAIAAGLVAAFAFGFAGVAASRAGRLIGARAVLAWAMVIGFAVAVPLTLLAPIPALDSGSLGWIAISGVGTVVGLFLGYAAFARGQVSIAAPILSTDGAVSALIAVLLGEAMSLPIAAVLGLIAVGIALAARGRDDGRVDPAAARRSVLLALAGSVVLGLALYATARLGPLGLGAAVLPSRAVGTFLLAIPLAMRARLPMTRRAAPLVLVSGLGEVIGVSAYVLGAADSIAVTAVLASQFASVAAICGFVLFGERPARTQVVGIIVIALGVAALAWLRS